MSDPVNLGELLSAPLSSYPSRPPLPGKKTFYGKLTGAIEAKRSSEKQTPFFEFGVRLTDPGKDVSAEMMKKITDAGFTLGDFDMTAEFYLTPRAMPMFREFLESLGFDMNKGLIENLKLDATTFEPTQETRDLIRAKDVLCRTQAADENGRVYSRLDAIAGVKRD